MRIAVVGAGAVGGYFGAQLSRGGHQVTLLARGAHLRAMQAHGLRVESVKSGTFVVRSPATDNPAEVGAVDLVIYAPRAASNEQTIPTLRPLLGLSTRILTLQNGVESAEELAAAYGWQRTLPGVTYIYARIKEPGVIAQISDACRILLGERNGVETASAREVWQALREADIDARLDPNIQASIWEKVLFSCAMVGFLSLARAPAGEVFGRSDMRAVITRLVQEAVAVAGARGVSFSPGVVERAMDGLEQRRQSNPFFQPGNGRPGEIDVPNAAVSRMGREAGVPTPVNDVVSAVVTLAQERAGRQPGT